MPLLNGILLDSATIDGLLLLTTSFLTVCVLIRIQAAPYREYGLWYQDSLVRSFGVLQRFSLQSLPTRRLLVDEVSKHESRLVTVLLYPSIGQQTNPNFLAVLELLYQFMERIYAHVDKKKSMSTVLKLPSPAIVKSIWTYFRRSFMLSCIILRLQTISLHSDRRCIQMCLIQHDP